MAEPLRLDETISRLFEANLRWYEALGRVSADYVRAVSRILTDTAMARTSAAPSVSAPARPVQPAAQAATLVLEAENGQLAKGMFMVENRLGRQVSASVVTSAFTDPEQRQVWPTIRVQPGNMTLDPGGRALVQITALVNEALGENIRYAGHISVPGLSDTPIPVALRRLPTFAPPPSSSESASSTANDLETPDAGAPAVNAPKRRRTARRRRTR
jgi:hypothetical protein